MIWLAPILGLLKKVAIPVLLALLMALVTWAAINTVKTNETISNLEKSVTKANEKASKAEKDLSDGRAAGAKDLLAAQDKNRTLELTWQKKYDEANTTAANEKRATQVALASTVAERDRLRNETRASTAYPQYASGAACNPEDLRRVAATAATLGELLVTSDGISESLGRQAEGLATQVRYYQSAVDGLQ